MNVWTQLLSMFTNSNNSGGMSSDRSALASVSAPTYGAQPSEDMGSGAEAMLSGAPLATGTGAEGSTGLDWGSLFKNMLQGASKGSKGLEILTNFPKAVPSPETPMMQLAPMQYTTMTQFLQTLLSGRH